ncbi:MAG: hypothetical protein EU540_07585, partial [Promethearchaeota archaeon]
MSYIKQHEDILKNEMAKLKNEVHIIAFTDVKEQNGQKVRRCMSCDGTMSLLEHLSEFSKGKLMIEEKSIDIDIDDAKKYNVSRIPTILFIDQEGKEVIRYM